MDNKNVRVQSDLNPAIDGTVERESHFGGKGKLSLGLVEHEVTEEFKIQQKINCKRIYKL